ncbi:phosphatidylinositol-4-phosphate 5-kinase, type I, beta a [Pangasianodon hypophthalmus]|nr:phosphatidylinositol-4-phosphate 5-kinase, type I, beta a [Pangasianodon hypophthalmus]
MGGTVFKKINPLRGASSRRKRNSVQPVRSASHEVLSPIKEERSEERKAQSLENLDDNDLGSFVKPDIIPSSTDLHTAVSAATVISISSSDDLNKFPEDDDISRGECGNSSSTLALDDSAFRSDSSHCSTSDAALDVYL